MKIILASASPRRRDLLKQMGVKFEVRVPDADETGIYGSPDEVVKTLAVRKADKVFCAQDEVIVSADTVVFIDGRILNKPSGYSEAFRMLEFLSGRRHEVFTGVCVRTHGGKIFTDVCRTNVFFRKLGKDEIDEYIKTGEASDKAGSYAIQGRGALFVEKIEGDYNNVVGLPLVNLAGLLKKAGVKI